jgi:pimeloyl-ACP methyl ester carboxylesterase
MLERELGKEVFSTNVRFKDIKNIGLDMQLNSISIALNTLSYLSPQLSALQALKFFTKTRYKRHIARGIFADIEPDIVNIEGENLAIYHFRQDKRDAPRVLLTHGWEGQASDFYKIVPELLRAGFEVVAFDGPAHGISSGENTNMFHFVEVIEGISERYGPFNASIAHSIGGIASSVASRLSKHFNPQKLIVIGSPNKLEVVLENFAKNLSLNKNIVQSMHLQIEKLVGLKVKDVSLEKILKGQEVKLLLIYDMDDDMVPYKRALEIVDKVKNANLITTSGLGHVKILRDENVIKQLSSFIT